MLVCCFGVGCSVVGFLLGIFEYIGGGEVIYVVCFSVCGFFYVVIVL